MKLESLFSIPATDAEPRIPLRCGSNLWKDDFPLRVMWHDHRRNRKMHSHDFWELVIVVAGSCRHLMPEGEFHLSEGNVFILHPGMSHAYESVSDFALVNLLYGKNLIPELDMEDSPGYRALFHWNDSAGRIRYLKLTRKALEEMKDRIGFLEITLENRLPGYRFYAVAQFMEIIYRLSEYSMTGTGVQRQHDTFQLGSLLDYMQHHCREELRIAKLAEQFFYFGSDSLPDFYERVRRAAGPLPEPSPHYTGAADASEFPRFHFNDCPECRFFRQQLFYEDFPEIYEHEPERIPQK